MPLKLPQPPLFSGTLWPLQTLSWDFVKLNNLFSFSFSSCFSFLSPLYYSTLFRLFIVLSHYPTPSSHSPSLNPFLTFTKEDPTTKNKIKQEKTHSVCRNGREYNTKNIINLILKLRTRKERYLLRLTQLNEHRS